MMKKLMSATLIAAIGAFMIGCSAEVEPVHSTDSGTGSYDKQTTVVQHPDGSVDKTVKTQSNP